MTGEHDDDYTWPDGRLFKASEDPEVNASYNRPADMLTPEMLDRALQELWNPSLKPWLATDRPRGAVPAEPVPLAEDEDRAAWVDGVERRLTAAIKAIRRGDSFDWRGPADQIAIRVVPYPLGWR